MMWMLKCQMRNPEVFKLKTSSGNKKYPHLKNVVKAALVLPHGNADVGRGVSVNNRIVTAERNLVKIQSMK